MQQSRATNAPRIHALTIISTALVLELKEVAAGLNAFKDSPKGNPLSPTLGLLHRAAAFCGYWGVANYIFALQELAKGIETIPVQEVERAEYLDRVKVLATGINSLGVYLRDMSTGVAVSYTALNEQYGRVARKVRPSLLTIPPAELAPSLFMPVPPSLEVDAHWSPAPGAEMEALLGVLHEVESHGLTAERLQRLANVNPVRSLSGLFEVAAAQPDFVMSESVAEEALEEFSRIREKLTGQDTVTPPMPEPFFFSKLLHALAISGDESAPLRALRRRYALTRPGTTVSSMHDVARKYSEGMKRFQDAFYQSTLSRTSSSVAKGAAQVANEAHKLESAAFMTFSAALAELTSSWSAVPPDTEGWVHGAALVLLMREAAETWGNAESQESLAGLADMVSGAREIFPCATMQKTTRSVAVQKAVDALALDFVEVNKTIESSLRSVGNADLEGPQAARVAETLGKKVREHMATISGVATCLKLPQAAEFADAIGLRASDESLWALHEGRMSLFESMARLNLFLARLRPGSMLDMEPDEQVEFSVVASEPEKAEASTLQVLTIEAGASAPQDLFNVSPTSGAAPAVAEVVEDSDEVAPLFEEPLIPEALIAGSVAEAEVAPDVAIHAIEVASEVVPEESAEFAPLAIGAVEGNELALNNGAASHILNIDAPEVVEAVPEDDIFAVDSNDVAHSDPFAFDSSPICASPAADSTAPSLCADELEREFVSAQEGRSTKLDTNDTELLTIMFEESWDCLEAIDGALAAAKKGGAYADGTVPLARRHIHTLKGVCRTCGLDAIGATLHAMEDRLEVMPDDGLMLSAVVVPFERAMALVRSQLEVARAEFHGTTQSAAEAVPVMSVVIPETSGSEVQPPEAQVVAVPEVAADEGVAASAVLAPHAESPAIDERNVDVPAPAVQRASPQTSGARSSAGTVRIPVQLAGRMGESSGQVLMASRRAMEDQAKVAKSMRELDENLKRMGPAIRELEMMAATSIASSQHQGGAQGFDPLELDRYTQMQEVVRRLVEAFEDTVNSASTLSDGLKLTSANEQHLAELSDELQRGSSELLLVPVATQQTRLERVLAKACADTGKQAELVIEPGCRVPAAALDKLMPVFEHIVRNAMAHGIEAAEVRASVGKPSTGRVVIGLPTTQTAEGGVVRISVRDDGAGINLERVRSIAAKRGLIQAGSTLSDDATRELLFIPGFSTAGSVSELAGRGVGLDVVRSALSSLGGVVTVQSETGQGTEFTLTLPSDSASMSVVPVTAGGFKCLLPLVLVRRIVPVSAGADVVLDVAAGKATISGSEYELIDMASRLPTGGAVTRAGRGHLVLMKESNIAKAVLVDHVGQQTRVVVKPLGPFVRDIPGMVAGTTMAAGAAGLVVNPLQLSVISHAPAEAAASRHATRVMVVDDSSTVRLVTSRFLKRSGYAVDTARDGLDALQQLAKGSLPDIFLFDLEMPGMGGFELIAEVRRKAEFAGTPIVIITSRTAEKHRERAMQLGATAGKTL